MKRIVCGKYGANIDLSGANKMHLTQKQRLGSINPNSLKNPEYFPIATNGVCIVYGDGEKKEVIDFLSNEMSDKCRKLIVLTNNERNLILPYLIDFDMDVAVLECKYPIFRHIRYFSDPQKNLFELKRILAKLRKLEISGESLGHYFSTKSRFNIERKLRFKNDLDQFFAQAYHGPYQEVFKLKEERASRTIIAVDFNSMFPSCMAGQFVDPTKLTYKAYSQLYTDQTQLENGLYRVILKYCKDKFFCDYHPFKYADLGNKLPFKMNSKNEIEMLLLKNELEHYSRYFSEVIVLEGISSKYEISHPLYNQAIKVYDQRLNAKQRDDHDLERFYKFWLVTLHSASNPKKSRKLNFSSFESVKTHLSNRYMFDFKNKTDALIFEQLNNIHDFKLVYKNRRYQLEEPRFDQPDQLYSLSSQILANSRLRITNTLETFLSFPSVEICYINVDSIHLSIETNLVSDFLNHIRYMISDQMGDLKIQCIADKGYWFDIGRYWLFKKNQVAQFKNIIFNTQASKTPFKRSRLVDFVRKDGIFRYIKTKRFTIENSFNYDKRLQYAGNLDYADFTRYDFDEIQDTHVAGDTLNNEIMCSKGRKIELFNSLATV